MAMLVLPEVFERTWGQRAPLFWPIATQRVRERVPGFLFMAGVYWDLEWTLQPSGLASESQPGGRVVFPVPALTIMHYFPDRRSGRRLQGCAIRRGLLAEPLANH